MNNELKIKNVNIIKFKYIVNFEINFDDKINIIVGNNASGKTTILEAIYWCIYGKTLFDYPKEETDEFKDVKVLLIVNNKERLIHRDSINNYIDFSRFCSDNYYHIYLYFLSFESLGIIYNKDIFRRINRLFNIRNLINEQSLNYISNIANEILNKYYNPKPGLAKRKFKVIDNNIEVFTIDDFNLTRAGLSSSPQKIYDLILYISFFNYIGINIPIIIDDYINGLGCHYVPIVDEMINNLQLKNQLILTVAKHDIEKNDIKADKYFFIN